MPTYTRYAEDKTGVNPDNLVSGEAHTLSNSQVRVIIPTYGPFFSNNGTLRLYDGVTMGLLIKGTDYEMPMLLREPSLYVGQEISDAILIINTNVASQVLVTYQTLGGEFQNNVDNIVNIFEAYLQDNRVIDWMNGVINKPTGFPPSPHPHDVGDLFGFGAMAMGLERIERAIILGQTPAYQMLIEEFGSKLATIPEMETGEPLDKGVSLAGLLHVLSLYNFNSSRILPESSYLTNGSELWVDVIASNVDENQTYYWTIRHTGTVNADFTAVSGVCSVYRGIGRFMIQSTLVANTEAAETFVIELRRNSTAGQIIAQTFPLTLSAHADTSSVRVLDALRAMYLGWPAVRRTAKTNSIIARRKHVTPS